MAAKNSYVWLTDLSIDAETLFRISLSTFAMETETVSYQGDGRQWISIPTVTFG